MSLVTSHNTGWRVIKRSPILSGTHHGGVVAKALCCYTLGHWFSSGGCAAGHDSNFKLLQCRAGQGSSNLSVLFSSPYLVLEACATFCVSDGGKIGKCLCVRYFGAH